jgi:hypothetical protein
MENMKKEEKFCLGTGDNKIGNYVISHTNQRNSEAPRIYTQGEHFITGFVLVRVSLLVKCFTLRYLFSVIMGRDASTAVLLRCDTEVVALTLIDKDGYFSLHFLPQQTENYDVFAGTNEEWIRITTFSAGTYSFCISCFDSLSRQKTSPVVYRCYSLGKLRP